MWKLNNHLGWANKKGLTSKVKFKMKYFSVSYLLNDFGLNLPQV
jgi:hypothetical protein